LLVRRQPVPTSGQSIRPPFARYARPLMINGWEAGPTPALQLRVSGGTVASSSCAPAWLASTWKETCWPIELPTCNGGSVGVTNGSGPGFPLADVVPKIRKEEVTWTAIAQSPA